MKLHASLSQEGFVWVGNANGDATSYNVAPDGNVNGDVTRYHLVADGTW